MIQRLTDNDSCLFCPRTNRLTEWLNDLFLKAAACLQLTRVSKNRAYTISWNIYFTYSISLHHFYAHPSYSSHISAHLYMRLSIWVLCTHFHRRIQCASCTRTVKQQLYDDSPPFLSCLLSFLFIHIAHILFSSVLSECVWYLSWPFPSAVRLH